jgi:hypothetical protein
MAMNWLVPITKETPLTFGADRLPFNGPLAIDFHKKLSAAHPRCLMSFKAQLLLSDESEEACGGSDLVLNWAGRQDIYIDGELVLSHCAKAFMDCIPKTTEILTHLGNLTTSDWDDTQLVWLEQMQNWLSRGYRVILMREA